MAKENIQLTSPQSQTDSFQAIAESVSSLTPWLGDSVSDVLSGRLHGRKLARIREVLEGVASDVSQLKSEASENYVKTEDFEDLLEITLQKVAKERSDEKRKIYRGFLSGCIANSATTKNEQDDIRFLRLIDNIQPPHLRILWALSEPPENDSYGVGSPSGTILRRVPEIQEDDLKVLLDELKDWRLISLSSPKTMMSNAVDLRHFVEPLGKRFVQFLKA